MKFRVQKSDVYQLILNASRFCHGKIISSTALQGILLTCKENKLIIKASNLNDFFQGEIGVEVVEAGELLVENKSLLEFVGNLAEAVVEFEKTPKSLIVSQGQNRGEFSLLTVSEFVGFPELVGEKIVLDPSLYPSLAVLQISISKDESKPAMTGLRFATLSGNGCLVSTDGFRLGILRSSLLEPDLNFTISATFLGEILRLTNSGKKIELEFDRNQGFISLQEENNKIMSRIISGDYPPYERVIREDFVTKAVVVREEMLRALRLISVFAKNAANVVVLKISKEGIFLTQKNTGENPSQAFVEMGEFEGEELSVAFNLKYLLDYFSAVKAKNVLIKTNPGNTPVLFQDQDSQDLHHIIMPLRLD